MTHTYRVHCQHRQEHQVTDEVIVVESDSPLTYFQLMERVARWAPQNAGENVQWQHIVLRNEQGGIVNQLLPEVPSARVFYLTIAPMDRPYPTGLQPPVVPLSQPLLQRQYNVARFVARLNDIDECLRDIVRVQRENTEQRLRAHYMTTPEGLVYLAERDLCREYWEMTENEDII